MDELPDVERLAEMLRALANPNRLQLLYELRSPRSVPEIELTPEDVPAGENPERPISQQAVRKHLSKLSSIDLLVTETRQKDGHLVDAHVLNHPRLYAIVEELRSLGELKAERPPAEQETIAADRTEGDQERSEPRLVIVHGQREGRAFPLRVETRQGERGWILGRKQGLAVSLDYDPFVSSENSRIVQDGDGFALHDLPDNRNGTFLNFQRLPPGGSSPLSPGDIIGVGRTNLVYQRP